MWEKIWPLLKPLLSNAPYEPPPVVKPKPKPPPPPPPKVEIPEPPKPEGVLIGAEDGREIYIPPSLRIRHLYLIGQPRQGKTNLMINLAVQDMIQGHGVGFIDPHADAAHDLLALIPIDRIDDVIYFDPTSPTCPAFNIFQSPFPDYKLTEDIISVFKMFFLDSWGPRLEHILRYSILTLLQDTKPHSLADLRRILLNPDFRESINIPRKLRSFWDDEFPRMEKTATGSITNKLSTFLLPGSPMERLFSQTNNDINFEQILNGKIFIANLAKGLLGAEPSRLLGGLLVTGLQQAALARAGKSHRPDFYLYVDEFQNFTVNSFNEILAETPKYKMYLTMAHQFLRQVSVDLRRAISGTVGTTIAFQVDKDDAEEVRGMMNTSGLIWRRRVKPKDDPLPDEWVGKWQPIETFRPYALQVIKHFIEAADKLNYDHYASSAIGQLQTILRQAETAYAPNQLRALARASIVSTPGKGTGAVRHHLYLFLTLEIKEEDFPSHSDLINLPRYTAFARLGSTKYVHRIQTIECPKPDPTIREQIISLQPKRELLTPPPIDEKRDVILKDNGVSKSDPRRFEPIRPEQVPDAPRRQRKKTE